MDLTNEQIAQFNDRFERAANRQKKLVFLDGYKRKSLSFFGKKKLNRSIEDFKACLEMVPEHWQSMVLMAKAYQRLGSHSEAFELLEKAFSIEPNNATIPMEASLEAMHLNDINKAIFYSEQSMVRDPGNPALIGNHAMNLLIAERDDEAKKVIGEAMELNPNDRINKRIEKTIREVLSGRSRRPTFKDAIG